ncbi:hypothetical protein VTJ83DRAFT_4188 [Remersonia thermophila]|uniref:Uncharacterized protein n=1 Tax=Remersonia thermophila TaxID=72144 RepID=A0ABR4D9A1_9PEZI
MTSSTSRPLRVSLATDILADPVRSALPRYAAYRRARARFWEAFPDGDGRGGAYVRLPTSGAALECGLHALALSLGHQLPSQPAAARLGLRPPGVAELREVVRLMNRERSLAAAIGPGDGGLGRGVVGVGGGNWSWFGADEVAAIFYAWGSRVRSGVDAGEGKRPTLRFQLGWVTDPDPEAGDEGWPVMMNTPEVETGEEAEDIVRVWIWNDGGSLRGGVGHFEGIRRPTKEELEEAAARGS